MNHQKKTGTVFKYGAYSAIMTGIVLAIIVVVNLIASQLHLKFDLTKDKLYSLSEQTEEISKEIKKDVLIRALYETGKEDITTKQIFEQYEKLSPYITAEFTDPYLNPQLLKKYTENSQSLPIGTVIVESGDKFRVITMEEMATYVTDANTGIRKMETLNIESCITGAISYVVSEESYKLYTLTGHEESPLDQGLLNQLKYANFDIMQLDLISAQMLPKDMDILMINAPIVDISQQELDMIKNYLSENGRAVINVAITAQELPHLTELLNYYGVSANQAMTIEGSTNYVYQNNPYNLIPAFLEHEITKPLTEKNQRVFYPYAQGIDEVDVKRSSVDVTPLLITSDSAYGKKVITDVQAFEKTPEDIDGPFSLAAAVKDEWFDEDIMTTKVIVLSGVPLLDTEINSIVNGGNFDFFMNCISWLSDENGTISVRPKAIQSSTYLQLNQTQAIVIMILSVIIFPILIFAVGIVVMLRRRNR